MSSTLLPELHRPEIHHYYGVICHLLRSHHLLVLQLVGHPMLKKNTSPKQASPVKSYSLYAIPSVLTQQVIQISGVPTFCKVTHLLCQFRFACAMYHILARASFPPCRCQQRSCLRIDFPLVRRQGFLQPFGSLPMLGKQKVVCQLAHDLLLTI